MGFRGADFRVQFKVLGRVQPMQPAIRNVQVPTVKRIRAFGFRV